MKKMSIKISTNLCLPNCLYYYERNSLAAAFPACLSGLYAACLHAQLPVKFLMK